MSGSRKRKNRAKKTSDFWTLPEGLRLHQQHQAGSTTSLPSGCGVSTLLPEDLSSMRTLCDDILRKLTALVPWGDGWTDRKSRGYAMLPNLSDFPNVQSLVEKGILMHDVDATLCSDSAIRDQAAYKHDYTVRKSFTSMDLPLPQIDAIQRMIDQVNAILQDPSNLPYLQSYERDAVNLRNLVAIQPNFHNGDDYLPLHLDNPRHDGFGVVIVTVALWGSADVVLVDDGDAEVIDEHNLTEDSHRIPGTGDYGVPNTNSSVATLGVHQNENVKVISKTVHPREGGIVFKDGFFVVTQDGCSRKDLKDTTVVGENPSSTLPSPNIEIFNHTSILTSCSPANGPSTLGTTRSDSTSLWNTSHISTTQPCEERAATVTKNVENDRSARKELAPYAAPTTVNSLHLTNNTLAEDTTSSSMSWVFPLHPGQLYVLSGPARNKCAHGIVVHPPAMPVAVTHVTDKPTVKSANGQKKKRVSIADTETDTRSTANPTSSDGFSTHLDTSNSIASEQQPEKYKGRVSLNFRFGIHTPEQARQDIDRHWG